MVYELTIINMDYYRTGIFFQLKHQIIPDMERNPSL